MFFFQVCVEKLLYSCKDIDKVFVLIRDKKDESVAKRMDKIIESPVSNIMYRVIQDGHYEPYRHCSMLLQL